MVDPGGVLVVSTEMASFQLIMGRRQQRFEAQGSSKVVTYGPIRTFPRLPGVPAAGPIGPNRDVGSAITQPWT
jgi:hypothetical protein